jgi:CubicO group peptidase (beta-lactamase class C family)
MGSQRSRRAVGGSWFTGLFSRSESSHDERAAYILIPMKRRSFWLMILLVVLMVGTAIWRPDNALRSASGFTAHNLCSAAFISGLDPQDTANELVKPMLPGFIRPLLHYHLDREHPSVEANVAGMVPMRAVFTEGYGCRMALSPKYQSPMPVKARGPSPADDFAHTTLVITSDPAISAALSREFADDPGESPRYVKAIVIVKDGRLVAERYARGFSIDTPLLSYSVAKSFTNALLGILVRQGRLSIDQPIFAPEWSHSGDPRQALTIDDLLRMDSGIDAPETGSGFDPVSQMLYSKDDMAAFAAGFRLGKPPRTEWDYTSANTLILDRLLGITIGGGAPGMHRFADDELFAPLHMDHVTMEFDGAGTFVGSAHVYASARDYARFGQLFLNDGVGADGVRILPEGWTAYSRRSTLGSTYGAGFWTNDGSSQWALQRIAHGFPKDGFFASGNRGQRIYIVPSEHLIVARFGYSPEPDFGIVEDLELIQVAIKALRNDEEHSK